MQIFIANEEEKQFAFALRFEVFVDEQRIPYELEIDEEDDHALHILAVEDGIHVGCARLICREREAYIGRLVVKKAYRKRGIGAAICRFAIDLLQKRGYTHICLHAQTRAAAFYKKIGFETRGDIFMEDGIEHIKMEFVGS